jgi:transcription elongation factor GreA
MENYEYLTKEKFDELKAELESLKTVKRKEIAENLEYSKGLGDLSENAEYHEAREAQANLEERIAKLEKVIKTAVIVSDKHGSTVSIGSIVKVRKDGTKGDQQFTLVGSEEVDVATGKISIHSPLGTALVGKKKGEVATFNSPGGNVSYTIVDVK